MYRQRCKRVSKYRFPIPLRSFFLRLASPTFFNCSFNSLGKALLKLRTVWINLPSFEHVFLVSPWCRTFPNNLQKSETTEIILTNKRRIQLGRFLKRSLKSGRIILNSGTARHSCFVCEECSCKTWKWGWTKKVNCERASFPRINTSTRGDHDKLPARRVCHTPETGTILSSPSMEATATLVCNPDWLGSSFTSRRHRGTRSVFTQEPVLILLFLSFSPVSRTIHGPFRFKGTGAKPRETNGQPA